MSSSSSSVKKKRVAVIGAGMPGICVASKLRRQFHNLSNCQQGLDQDSQQLDLSIFEIGQNFGGTWFFQRYPGVACDSPSQLYSFWFHQNPGFKQKFASAHGLQHFTRFQTEVIDAVFNDLESCWICTIKDVINQTETVEKFDFVISCAGGQRLPRKPSHLFDHFKGPIYHTAEYPSGLDLTGKTVAVVGTGSSSIQVVPAIADKVKQLYVFQRSPGWILKLPRGDFSSSVLWWFENVPGVLFVYRVFIWIYFDFFIHQLLHFAGFMKNLATNFLNDQVPEPVLLKDVVGSVVSTTKTKTDLSKTTLRQALTPSWSVGCRRVMVSDTFYGALMKPNVTFIPSAVLAVAQDGKTLLSGGDDDGWQTKVDIVIAATGYDYQSWIRPMSLCNHNGEELVNVWIKSSVRGRYYGLATSGFPNLFTLFGPASRPGQGALSVIAEYQADAIIRILNRVLSDNLDRIEVKIEAETKVSQMIENKINGSIFDQDCKGWYKDENGKTTTVWPSTALHFWWALRMSRFENVFTFRPSKS